MLYSSGQKGLAQAYGSGLLGSTVTTTVTGVSPGDKFYIKTQPYSGGITGSGAYGLLVNFGTGTMSPITPPNTVVLSKPDQGGGSSNDETPVQIGSLLSVGDNLSIAPNFLMAMQIVDAGAGLAGHPHRTAAAILLIENLVANAHFATSPAMAQALRAKAILAIDNVLNAWIRVIPPRPRQGAPPGPRSTANRKLATTHRPPPRRAMGRVVVASRHPAILACGIPTSSPNCGLGSSQ